jgi:hypothetical protein
MNSASNKVSVKLSSGRQIQIQVVHLSDPEAPRQNPSGDAEDYCVIFEEGGTQPLLFRIATRSPLRIEQLDINSPQGRDHWNALSGYLKGGA